MIEARGAIALLAGIAALVATPAARAEEVVREVAALCVQLHAALVKTALERDDR